MAPEVASGTGRRDLERPALPDRAAEIAKRDDMIRRRMIEPRVRHFDSEPEDQPWATDKAREVKRLVPNLEEVRCKSRQCRAIVRAKSVDDLQATIRALREQDDLRHEAQWAQTPPTTLPDGTLEVQVYGHFAR